MDTERGPDAPRPPQVCEFRMQAVCPIQSDRVVWAVAPPSLPGMPNRRGWITRYEPTPGNTPGAWLRDEQGREWQFPLTDLTIVSGA